MRITEVDKGLTQSELDQLEVFADRLFAKVGIDVEFTRHFLDRVNDERNVKQITASELTRLFKQEYKRWGKPIAQMGPDSEAVLKDLATDVNIPFALRWDSANNELDLIAKTVMRKKNFKTSNKEFEVQSVDYSLDNIQHKKVFESIQQLNEALQFAPLPIAVVAWNALVAFRYSQQAWYASLAVVGSVSTMYNINIYIVNDNTGAFSWFEKKMAASAILAGEMWDSIRGVEDLSNSVVEKELTTLSTELQTGVETLKSQYTDAGELSPGSAEIIASVDASANLMAQQIADGVDPSTIAKTYIDSLTTSTGASSSEVEAAEEINKAAGQVINQIAVVSPEVVSAIQTELEANYQNASGQRAAELEAQIKRVEVAQAKADAQTKASDDKLIALATSISAAQAQRDNDAYQNNKIDDIAAKSDADAKATAQTRASDDKLIALATSVAATNAQQANDAYQNDKIDNIANKSDAAAKAAKSAAATAANNAYQNNKIDDIATKSDADAKATAQTRASDDKLIKTAQAYAAAQAQAANDKYQNDKIDNIATKSDAAAAAAELSKAIAAAQAANDAYQNSKIDDIAAKSDADAKAKELEKALATAKSVADVGIGKDIDITIPDTGTITRPDALDLPGTTTGVDIHPGTVAGATAQGNAAAAAAAALADAKEKAIANARANTKNNNSGKKKTKKVDWGLGDGDYWDTNLYKWTQKYGTFENQNLIKKYFMINEGGAMPGVGAIHIDEITPTLQALEKSIGVDLMNNTLGSVGKRQFSGDIDVALQIQPEELPAFIEELKKNPLVLDIAKSSVIMTKVKIADFDQSKSDGRPRTGFVQVDFMPGDPGWMKTYYHSPSETESKYKGVYRNIMIATLAAVHNRDQSDAKLDDGRAMEERRFMWSPTEGLLRVQRTPVPKKNGDGYTKKNKNETIDGPWKQPDEIAAQLGLDSGKDLNSFESLWTAVKKNWTKEKLQYVIDGFKQNNVVQDIGVPEELDDVS